MGGTVKYEEGNIP